VYESSEELQVSYCSISLQGGRVSDGFYFLVLRYLFVGITSLFILLGCGSRPRPVKRSSSLPRVLVLNIQGDTAVDLTGQVRRTISDPNVYRTLSSENVEALLPEGTELEDCSDMCSVNIGRTVGADWVVAGKVREGKYLSLEVFRSLEGTSVFSESSWIGNTGELARRLAFFLKLNSATREGDAPVSFSRQGREGLLLDAARVAELRASRSMDLEAMRALENATQADSDPSISASERLRLWDNLIQYPDYSDLALRKVQHYKLYLRDYSRKYSRFLEILNSPRVEPIGRESHLAALREIQGFDSVSGATLKAAVLEHLQLFGYQEYLDEEIEAYGIDVEAPAIADKTLEVASREDELRSLRRYLEDSLPGWGYTHVLKKGWGKYTLSAYTLSSYERYSEVEPGRRAVSRGLVDYSEAPGKWHYPVVVLGSLFSLVAAGNWLAGEYYRDCGRDYRQEGNLCLNTGDLSVHGGLSTWGERYPTGHKILGITTLALSALTAYSSYALLTDDF
jgi:hypothetical protein